MVTGRSPFFDEIRGAFEICDIRTRKNKKIEIAKYRIPSNPRTQAQQAVRTKYAQAAQGWRSLTPEQKAQYNALGKPLGWSGWNYYLWEQYQVQPFELTLYPSADTFVDKSTPTSNYGTWTQIRTDPSSTYTYRSLLKWDLSQIRQQATITEAKFYLYYYAWAANNPTGRQQDVLRVTSTWAENTVTWNTQPTFDTTIWAYANIPASPGWLIFNITDLVQKWVNGTYTNYGILLRDHGEGIPTDYTIYFYSREASSNKPYLYIKGTQPG